MSKSKVAILLASTTLVLGKHAVTGDPIELPAGEEMTPELAKSLKLSDKDIKSLTDSGHLAKVEVRASSVSADGSDTGQQEIADLKKQLAAETKRADDAEADYNDLEKHVTVLEEQIKSLGADPTPQEDSSAEDAGKGEKKA